MASGNDGPIEEDGLDRPGDSASTVPLSKTDDQERRFVVSTMYAVPDCQTWPLHANRPNSPSRRVDLCILPLLGALYAVCVVDRGNLGLARVAGMDHDLVRSPSNTRLMSFP